MSNSGDLTISTYDPAGDEQSLDSCVHRLHEILEELGAIGEFLEGAPKLDAGPDFEARVADAVERNRIPGFCGHRLLQECRILMELITVRVAVLRENCARQGNGEKVAELEAIEAAAHARLSEDHFRSCQWSDLRNPDVHR